MPPPECSKLKREASSPSPSPSESGRSCSRAPSSRRRRLHSRSCDEGRRRLEDKRHGSVGKRSVTRRCNEGRDGKQRGARRCDLTPRRRGSRGGRRRSRAGRVSLDADDVQCGLCCNIMPAGALRRHIWKKHKTTAKFATLVADAMIRGEVLEDAQDHALRGRA